MPLVFVQKIEDHRKKWDKEEYEQLARERIEAEQRAILEGGKKEAPIRRELLKPRDYRVCGSDQQTIYCKIDNTENRIFL